MTTRFHLHLFFSNDSATAEFYTLSLHDALPICVNDIAVVGAEPLFLLDYIGMGALAPRVFNEIITGLDRKSTRLNSSHTVISYTVFCLKKKTALPPQRTYPAPQPAP